VNLPMLYTKTTLNFKCALHSMPEEKNDFYLMGVAREE
jgi:hypothetical protein